MNLNYEKKVLFKGNWIQLNSISNSNKEKSKEKNNEYISRLTKKSYLPYDALSLIPLITYKSKPNKSFVLIAQFRPPSNSFVLETVAGLAEDKDPFIDIERELLEESGFSCEKTLKHESPNIAGDGNLFEIMIKTYTINIDGDKEENKNPKQNLEDEENIIVHQVEIKKNLSDDLIKICNENKYILADRVWFLAMGFDS